MTTVTLLALLLSAPNVSAPTVSAPTVSAATPNPSLPTLVSSNGFGTLGFTLATNRFDHFIQHAYKYESSGVSTRDILQDAYFGLNLQHQQSFWTPNLLTQNVSYIPGTSIIQVQQSLAGVPGLSLTTYGFAPLGLARPSYVLLFEVTNNSGQAIKDIGLYSQASHPLSADRPIPNSSGEYIDFNLAAAAFEQYGPYQNSAAAVVIYGAGLPTFRTSGGNSSDPSFTTNPYQELVSNPAGDFSNLVDANTPGYSANGISAGYEWPNATLAPGASAWAGIVVVTDETNVDGDAIALMQQWLSGVSDPESMLTREIANWPIATLPVTMPADEQAVYQQSLAVLTMAQVQEEGTSQGQILASLAAATSNDSNQWNIAWVRDMAYSVVALSEVGRFAEAKAALVFELQAISDHYAQAQYVGAPYQISVCRYTGDGVEESDVNQDGPNIEFDGFGLFLWSVGRYVALSQDTAFVTTYFTAFKGLVADVLVSLVDSYSDLLRADSSIWEVHWDGQQKQFAYSSIAAVAGLCTASDLANLQGQAALALTYQNAARTIRQALMTSMLDPNGVLAGSLDQLHTGQNYLDAAVIDAFNLGVLDPNGPIAQTTLPVLQNALSIGGSGSGRGIFRNQNGGAYDDAEWVFLDLRLSEAQSLAGLDGSALYRWVVEQAAANQNLIPELYDPNTTGPTAAAYNGSIPMVGFGAGAYILAANQRYGLETPWIACGSYSNTLEGGAEIDAVPSKTIQASGAGCASVHADWWWLPAALVLAVRRRAR